jgi:hypothetical protein
MTEEHHMVVVLLPLLLLLLMEQDLRLASKDGALLIGCVVLIGSRYSLDRFPAFHEGVPSLLMTGKILGLLLLAWMLVRRVLTTALDGAGAHFANGSRRCMSGSARGGAPRVSRSNGSSPWNRRRSCCCWRSWCPSAPSDTATFC